MKAIIGTKGKMTQIFDEKGVVSAATVITAAPMTVTQVKSAEKDGYTGVQFGAGTRKEKNLSNPVKGHLKDLGAFRYLRELPAAEGLNRGDKVDVSIFVPGDVVAVSAVSKGAATTS